MTKQKIYTRDVLQNLDNCTGDYPEDIEMNDQMKLLDFVDIWLQLFKKNSVKTSSYDRLVVSRNMMAKYDLAEKKLCEISFFDIHNSFDS